jgi:hypothetical protein
LFDIASMRFPVLAFTPIGVMPYSSVDQLRRCMPREWDLGWYRDLEIVDSDGRCAVIRSARIVRKPLFARLLGKLVEVAITDSQDLGQYNLAAVQDRVMEFLAIYPHMYLSAGAYDDIVRRVKHATTTEEIARIFLA